MMYLTSVVFCLVGVTTLVSAAPFQVPAAACVNMSPQGPGHNHAAPQTTPVPFEFILQHTTIKSSENVEFTIRSDKDRPFAGFMIQVRDDKSATPEKPIGTFEPKDDHARTVTCSAENDTGSHNSPDPKTSVTLVWTPPADFKGQATFYATVAETRLQFWVKERAGIVNVE